MVKVKTFTQVLKIFHAKKELDQLDTEVNKFIEEQNIKAVISVNDAVTTDDKGGTMGIIRVLSYEA